MKVSLIVLRLAVTRRCWNWLLSANAPNWALVLVGVGGVVAALLTLRALRKQSDLLQDQTAATKDNAVSAKLSAQAVLNSERAWIEIKLGPPEKHPLDQEPSDLFECSIQIENHGRTVARIESVQVGADCISGPYPKEPFNYQTKSFHSLLGSGQQVTIDGFSADHGFPDWRSILDGTKRGVLRITVKYRDVVEATTLRETTAVYIFQNNLEDEPERVSSLSVYT